VSDIPAQEQFSELCQIVRAQHFAWRQAVRHSAADIDPGGVVDRMWDVTGEWTARSYAKRIDPTKPVAPQVASNIARSSASMGEEVSVESSTTDDESLVRHTRCPWLEWHRRFDLLEEDRRGCDRWFQSTMEHLSTAIGVSVRVETIQTMPEGAPNCERRIWVEE
jgi:L-2-amino-thiazoline-4-carboxylic acid hydrolase